MPIGGLLAAAAADDVGIADGPLEVDPEQAKLVVRVFEMAAAGKGILKIAKETYKSLYGKEPAVKAIHAGLECGIIGEKIPGMDMVSFGPTLEGVHSPDEKIYIDTVEKFWKFLLGILRNIN